MPIPWRDRCDPWPQADDASVDRIERGHAYDRGIGRRPGKVRRRRPLLTAAICGARDGDRRCGDLDRRGIGPRESDDENRRTGNRVALASSPADNGAQEQAER